MNRIALSVTLALMGWELYSRLVQVRGRAGHQFLLVNSTPTDTVYAMESYHHMVQCWKEVENGSAPARIQLISKGSLRGQCKPAPWDSIRLSLLEVLAVPILEEPQVLPKNPLFT